MPKVTDIKKYWRDTASKAGLDEADIKQVETMFDKPEALKAFTDGFKPLPDYSHDLDDVRNKTKTDKDAEYADWYKKEQLKYNEWVSELDRLKKYEETFGPLDVTNPPDPNLDRTRGGKTMTQEEIDKLVETKMQTVMTDTLARRDAAVLDLLDVREFHMSKFKTGLDVKAFESAWKEHPEWGGSLKIAYEKYVEPKVKEITDADVERRVKEAREEGVRDGYSRRSLPTDTAGREFSPMFNRKEDVAKLDESAQEQHSREAFFEGLREQSKQPA